MRDDAFCIRRGYMSFMYVYFPIFTLSCDRISMHVTYIYIYALTAHSFRYKM